MKQLAIYFSMSTYILYMWGAAGQPAKERLVFINNRTRNNIRIDYFYNEQPAVQVVPKKTMVALGVLRKIKDPISYNIYGKYMQTVKGADEVIKSEQLYNQPKEAHAGAIIHSSWLSYWTEYEPVEQYEATTIESFFPRAFRELPYIAQIFSTIGISDHWASIWLKLDDVARTEQKYLILGMPKLDELEKQNNVIDTVYQAKCDVLNNSWFNHPNKESNECMRLNARELIFIARKTVTSQPVFHEK